MTDAVNGERKGDVYAITLNRPATGNALSDAAIARLGDLLQGVDSDVRIITLQGAGDDFCVGREPPPPGTPRKVMEALELQRAHDVVFRVYGLIRGARAPVIAKVRGRAQGFGFALAAVADVTFAADDTTFQIPEFAHSIMPTMVASSMIDRVPLKAMMYRIYSTEPFSATEALQMGAVSAVTRPVALDKEVDGFIQRLLAAPTPALLAVKDYTRNAQAIDINKAVEYARALHAVVNTSSEMRKH